MPVPSVLVRAIQDGKFDDSLDRLTTLIRRRQELVAQRMAMSLKKGDAVRFNDKVRPQYLRFKPATVHHVSGDKIFVVLVSRIGHGRFPPNHPIGCSPNILERV